MAGLFFLAGLLALSLWAFFDSKKRKFEKFVQQATEGDRNSQYELAQKYEFGWEVAQDGKEAIKWYKLAAEAFSEAEYRIGRIYYEGRGGIEVDYVEAANWFRKSAERGSVFGMHGLGLMLLTGQGVSLDEAEAVKLFNSSAEKGFSGAQLCLGMIYLYGKHGVPQDVCVAKEWFQKAANQGVAMAQFFLGDIYFKGIGISPDFMQAYKWFSLYLSAEKSEKGDVNLVMNAALTLNAIKKDMTFVQKEEAEKLVKDFVPRIKQIF